MRNGGERLLIALLLTCGALLTFFMVDSSRSRERLPPPENSTTLNGIKEPQGSAPLAANTPATHTSTASVRSALPAPIRDSATIRLHLTRNAPATYIGAILAASDSILTRWPDRRTNPISVWIQPRSTLPSWRREHVFLVRDSFQDWRSTALPVRFVFTTDSAGAEIVVAWSAPMQGERIGVTRRLRDQHWWLVRAEIGIALQSSRGEVIPDSVVRAIAIHEIGHALGLDHSPNENDIMAAMNRGVAAPSQMDRATLALVYALPPGPLRR